MVGPAPTHPFRTAAAMPIPPDILDQARDLLAAGRYRVVRRLLVTGGVPPDDAAGLGLLGAALVGLNDHHAARAHLEAALLRTPGDPVLRFHLARALNGLGMMHAAVPILADLHGARPADAAVTEALANALRRDARYEQAIALVDAAEAQGRLDHAILYHRALSWHALGDAAAALADFDRLLADDPGHAAAWFASHACVLDGQGLPAALSRLRHAAACTGANRKYAAFLAAYDVLTGGAGTDGAAAASDGRAAILDGARALVPHLAPESRLFGLSADLLRFALSAASVPGLVLEFGVRRGTSLRHIAAACGQQAHGFDSFEGLPEGWGNEPAGTFSLGAELPAMPGNVTLHKGWFAQTLPDFLAAFSGAVRFANIDCDIYSSTVTVLTALAPRLVPGTILVFDEFIGNRTWDAHEFKAFTEFTSRTGMGFRHIAVSPFTGQVALRLE
ncbi:class I SAM-dependent methyltransferase [Niveispirillum fermenti]|uniref:class I SAM-dependent methyltransferase n=1 Tax=Niveispirillum fermenti TaxID=1233113 RepID=UPI003A856178